MISNVFKEEGVDIGGARNGLTFNSESFRKRAPNAQRSTWKRRAEQSLARNFECAVEFNKRV